MQNKGVEYPGLDSQVTVFFFFFLITESFYYPNKQLSCTMSHAKVS